MWRSFAASAQAAPIPALAPVMKTMQSFNEFFLMPFIVSAMTPLSSHDAREDSDSVARLESLM